MATEPEDRYGSARALVEEIERWMADEPVSAWREPLSRRAQRWGRRNRTVVATAAAAVLVALAGTAAVLAVQTRANRDLRAANEQTRQERDLARQNFELARRAVDDYMTRVGQNPLLKEQGLHELRQELLGAALTYYRDFLRQRGDDLRLRVETAAAHERVGDIHIELGRPSDALAAYDQALALIEPLVRDRPGEPATATAQVRLEAGRLQALANGGRYPEAIAAFDRVKVIGEELLSAGRGTEDLANILARMYCFAADVFQNTGRTDSSVGVARRAQELAERATRDRPGELAAARTRLLASNATTDAVLLNGRVDEARRVCEQGIAFGKARMIEHPRDVELRLSTANLEGELGLIEKIQGRPVEAVKMIRSAADALGALAREHPPLIRVRSRWADNLVLVSQLQTDLGLYADAEQSARVSLEAYEALAREVPSSSMYRQRVGLGYGTLGKVLLKVGSDAEGLTMLRKAVEILKTSDDSFVLYNLACALALASTISNPGEGAAAAERQRLDADWAVATIQRAIKTGFKYTDMFKTDPDFDSLRLRPDFQALMADLSFPSNPFSKGADADR
jgi:eukaryotic-like serine/threonine-protein kinase